MASLTSQSWNQLVGWFREVESLRNLGCNGTFTSNFSLAGANGAPAAGVE